MASNVQPLGTIIASMLNYDQLCMTLTPAEPAAFTAGTSTYAPCDGRSITGSQLNLRAPSVTVAPDLRGRFIRGLNQFYNIGEAPTVPGTLDPSAGRSPGTFQMDDYKTHTHGIAGSYYQEFSLQGPGSTIGLARTTSIQSGTSGGSEETRPKNVAVYYYIKIN